mgnify:CR=1 FL=1
MTAAVRGGGITLLFLAGIMALYVGISANIGRSRTAMAAPILNGCIDVLHHGGDNGGVRDNSAAFRAAMDVSEGDAVCIYFPAGIYRFSSSPTMSLPVAAGHGGAAITIIGDGSELSKLQFDPEISGLVLRLNGPQQSFHIRDLSILAGSKAKAVTGLSIIQENARTPNPAQSDISGVSIRGQDGFGAQFSFERGIFLHQVSNVNVMNTVIAGSSDGAPYASQGTCLYIDGAVSSIPVQINIVGSQINYCGRGIYYGPYVQGLQVLGSNFVGNGTAIYQSSDSKGNDQLAVVGSQFNSGERNILLGAPIDGVLLSGNDFYLSGTGISSIEMPGVQFAIQGNSFIQLGAARATAIAIGPFLLDAGVITGNSFQNFNTAIVLQPRSSRVNVQSNAYSDIGSDKVVDRGHGNTVGGGSI